jgi:hypothetical protein
MRAIIMFAQKELESVTSAIAPHHPALPALEAVPQPANQALLRLYDYLHNLSLHLLIELVCTQVNTLVIFCHQSLSRQLNLYLLLLSILLGVSIISVWLDG